MKRTAFVSTLLSLALTASAIAQPKPGDLILASDRGIHFADPSTGLLATLVRDNSQFQQYHFVAMNRRNDSLMAIKSGLGVSQIHDVLPNGVLTTLRTISGVRAGALSPDGCWYLVGGGLNGRDLLRFDGNQNGSLSTAFRGLPGTPGDIIFDNDTGDAIIVDRAITSLHSVVRVNTVFTSMTTIASGTGSMSGVDYDQRNGRIFATSSTNTHVRVATRFGLAPFAPLANSNGILVDDLTGHVYAYAGNIITEFDETGAVVKTHGPFAGITRISDVEIYGRRKLAARSPFQPLNRGNFYAAVASFIESPSSPYVCGFGLSGHRPGLSVAGGRTVNVRPDFYFFLSAGGDLDGFTVAFNGTTDVRGRANPGFLIPLLPSGTHLTLVAAALNPRKPGNLDVATALSFRTQ